MKSPVLKCKGLSKKELKAAFPDGVGELAACEIPSGYQPAVDFDHLSEYHAPQTLK